MNDTADKLDEGKKICVLCEGEFTGWGHNPEPLKPFEDGRACEACNTMKVIPARVGVTVEVR